MPGIIRKEKTGKELVYNPNKFFFYGTSHGYDRTCLRTKIKMNLNEFFFELRAENYGGTKSDANKGREGYFIMALQSSKRTTTRYFTTGRKKNPKILSEFENLQNKLFRIPPDVCKPEYIHNFIEEERVERYKNRRGCYANKQTYRSRLRLNLPERLYVPDVVTLPGKSITDDIDRDYYSLIAGRKIKVNKKTREYLRDIRNCFLTKLKIGYHTDEILKAEEKYASEKEHYEDTKRNFEVYLNSFEKFLEMDHSSSLELLKKAEAEKKISEEKEARIADLADRLRKLIAQLLILEERWATLKTYQKFLYNMSPSEWRKEFDDEFLTETTENERPEDEDLDKKIERFVGETSKGRSPALYFEHPEQVQRIFHELEKNNLIALTYCEDLEQPIQKMLSDLRKVKSEAEKNQEMLEEEISFMRELVEEEEKKAKDLRDKTKEVVIGMCKDFIVSEENIMVTALVEDAYEDAIAVNDYDLNMIEMMKEIENKYEYLLLTLDKQPYYVLAPAIKRFFRDEKRMEKEAREAERKVHQMEILLKRLSRSLTYPKKGLQQAIPRKLVHRSEPYREDLNKYGQLRVVTKEEKEFEYFFGKTCRNIGEAGFYRPLCSMSKSIFPSIPD